MTQNKAPIHALIFDMDGTMIDSMPTHKVSWGVFAKAYGLDMPLDEIFTRTMGRTGVECVKELFGQHLTDAQVLEMVEHKEATYRELFAAEFREVAGFKAFAHAALRHGLQIGVGTAGDQANVAFALSHLQMDVLPTAIVRGDMGFKGKPSPDIFLEGARQLNVLPASCLVFEDAPQGIEAARRAGMSAVVMTTTHTFDEWQQLTAAGQDLSHVLAFAKDYNHLEQQDFWTQISA